MDLLDSLRQLTPDLARAGVDSCFQQPHHETPTAEDQNDEFYGIFELVQHLHDRLQASGMPAEMIEPRIIGAMLGMLSLIESAKIHDLQQKLPDIPNAG
jgi:hypothetical protein